MAEIDRIERLIERLQNPPLYDNGEVDDTLVIADMAEAADELSRLRGREEDPFEHCAKEAEAQAELVEQMRCVYPGDPYNALSRDAKKMRKLASSIRALRPPTNQKGDQDGGKHGGGL